MDNEMEKWQEKANVLIEALPYIQKFNRKIIVVKYGGSAMTDEELQKNVIKDVTLLKLVGFKPIIVHGGGKEISRWINKVGMEPRFINGLRVTDEATMEIAEMVLGRVGKKLVTMVEELGVKAVSISGKDGRLLECEKKYAGGEDIGFVGEIVRVNEKILLDLIEKDFLPIVSPIGLDENFNTYNINADDAACAIARSVKAEKLAFLTDIEGVYRDPDDKTSLISELRISEARKLMENGNIGGGMLPKLNNCIDAIENGVSRVHILDGRTLHCLLLEIFTNKGIGTAILNDVDERFYKVNTDNEEKPDTRAYIEMGDRNFIHAYNRFPVVLERGDGVYLYDTDGKKYLDFGAGIAVFALGYNNKEFNACLKNQVDKLIHTSNLFYNIPSSLAADKITKATGFDKVFFTNSGAEAIEGAIKLAKRYAYNKRGGNDYEIIAMKHSFHGRTIGALSVTGNEHYQEPFRPLMPGVRFAEFNNIDSVRELLTDKTCAIIMETVQGEGGIYPAEPEFIKEIRSLCDANDIVMILDEIQCGMGRTGKLYAFENYGIKPDIFTTAKALGCGVPVGAFVASKKVCDAMRPGDHGTTYGGNPLVCAAVAKVYDMFEKYNVLENVKNIAVYLETELDKIVKDFPQVKARRGMGLMQGLVIDDSIPVLDIVKRAMDNGLIVISAGGNVLRLVPPLIISRDNVDEMTAILKRSL